MDTKADTQVFMVTKQKTDWHRLLGLIFTDFFTGSAWNVELEKDLSMKRQLLNSLFDNYNMEGIPVAYTMQDFQKDYVKNHLGVLSPDDRLRGLSPNDRLKGLSLSDRLKGISFEDIQQYLKRRFKKTKK